MAYTPTALDTQIVVQWDLKGSKASGPFDLSEYFSAENVIAGAGGDLFFEDGNDISGGVFNIFLYTDRPDLTVGKISELAKSGRLPIGMRIGVAVYKNPTHTDWTFRPAYPPDLKHFDLSPVSERSQ